MKKILLCLLFIMLWVSIASGQVIYDRDTHVDVGWTASPLTGCNGGDAGGEPVIGSLTWEVWLVRDVTGEVFRYLLPWNLEQMEVTMNINKPRSGVYVIKVRGVTDRCCDGTSPCNGGWAESTNPATSKLQDGTPGAWKVRFKPEGPVGPIIID